MENMEEHLKKYLKLEKERFLMSTYKIAVMPGDGTGPEVTVEAVKVLKAAADKFNFKMELTEFDFGGERYKKTGETLPDSAIEEFRLFIFGAIVVAVIVLLPEGLMGVLFPTGRVGPGDRFGRFIRRTFTRKSGGNSGKELL